MPIELSSVDFDEAVPGKMTIDYNSLYTSGSNTDNNAQQEIIIVEAHYQMDDDIKVSGKGDAPLLEMQFNLSENHIVYHDKLNREYSTSPRSAGIVYLSADDNEAGIYFKKGITYNTFDIHLPLHFLDQYYGESALMDNFLKYIRNDISSGLMEKRISITPAIYSVIRDMQTCAYDGLTKRIYLESKVYELVALLYEKAEKQGSFDTLNNLDQEKMHYAAAIIRENLDKPCSIIDLARMVGVNQTKLKSGFKALFGNTVFGYLQDIRMRQAKKYLLDTQFTIEEISLRLGYQSTSNFSAAFKKIYGYSPIKMRKNIYNVS